MENKNIKKIFLLVLEEKSATGICVMNVADALAKAGYCVDVITAGMGERCELKSINERIFRVEPKISIRLKRKGKLKKNKNLISFADFLNKIQVAFTSIFIWPWNAPVYTFKLYKKIKKIYFKEQYDLFIPVYTQVDPVIIGHMLKKKVKKLVVIPYFLDSLSGGPVPRLLSEKQKINRGIKWEKKLLSNVDKIIVMKSSEEHHKRYSKKEPYYSKMLFLDIPMLVPERENRKKITVEKNNIQITYIGSMPLKIRSPYYALNMLGKYRNVKVKIIGGVPDSKEYLDFCERNEQVELVGPVNHDEIHKFIEESDILINFGNNIAEMVPSKIFEYMSNGKPILSFSPSKQDPSIPYLERYFNSCIICETDDIYDNEKKLERFLSDYEKKRVCIKKVAQEFYSNTPQSFVDFINELNGGN